MTRMATHSEYVDSGLQPPVSFMVRSANADLTQLVIGAAMTVLNTLRPGLDEKLYERALVIGIGEARRPL